MKYPSDFSPDKSWWAALAHLQEQRQPHALVSVLAIRGSFPQRVGAKMVVGLKGLVAGTIGGGKVETYCLEVVEKKILMKESEPQVVKINLQRDLGMSCGGEAEILFEYFYGEKKNLVAIFGAGHVAQELAPLLLKLEFPVEVFDPREQWLNYFKKHEHLKLTHLEQMELAIDQLPESAFVVCVTMGHSFDFPILERALQNRKFPFVGVIGSEQKSSRLRRELSCNDRIAPERIKAMICPLGLSTGGSSPMEVALSVAAQINQSYYSMTPPVRKKS